MAVKWAKKERSIIWQNLLGLRTPLDDLRAKHPQLAGQLQNIAQRTEVPASRDTASANIRGSQSAAHWDNTVEESRRLPVFGKTKTFRRLAPAAYEGLVVIFNVGKSQSDALVLIADDWTRSRSRSSTPHASGSRMKPARSCVRGWPII